MKHIKKLLAVALALCMALGATACANTATMSKGTDWVYDYNGDKILSGVYIAFTMSAYSQAQKHADINSEITDLFKQTLDGKPAKQWIIDYARESIDQYIATNRKFDELGLTLDAATQNTISKNLESTWSSNGKLYEANGVSEESYKEILTNAQKQDMLFQKYYGKGGLEEVPEADLLAYFKDNFALVNSFTISLATGDNLTDEQKAANEERKKQIEEYEDLLNDGVTLFQEVYDRYLHDLTDTTHDAESEGEFEEDEESASYITKDSTRPSAEVVKAIFNLVPGEAKAINEGNVYYLVKRYSTEEDQKNFDNVREDTLLAMKSGAFKDMAKEWASTLNPTVNDATLNRYSPVNIITSVE